MQYLSTPDERQGTMGRGLGSWPSRLTVKLDKSNTLSLGQAAPIMVVCSSGTLSGTQEMVEGLALVFTLPYNSGPLGFDASINCSTEQIVRQGTRKDWESNDVGVHTAIQRGPLCFDASQKCSTKQKCWKH